MTEVERGSLLWAAAAVVLGVLAGVLQAFVDFAGLWFNVGYPIGIGFGWAAAKWRSGHPDG